MSTPFLLIGISVLAASGDVGDGAPDGRIRIVDAAEGAASLRCRS